MEALMEAPRTLPDSHSHSPSNVCKRGVSPFTFFAENVEVRDCKGSLWQLHDKLSLSSIITSHIVWYSYLQSRCPHIHKDFPLPCLTAWFAVFLSDFPEAKTFLFWRGSIGGAFFYRHIPSAIDFSCAWKRVADKTMGQGISAKNDGKPPFFWYNSV